MHQGRQRLRPWLEEQIQSGTYPGVVWIDEIPWKHAARHGWNIETDATLFRNWAIHTGRYKPGTDKPDPKTWKANFRCALNSLPDVKELPDQSIKKGHNAFRVYALLPHSKALKRRRASRSLDPDAKSQSPPRNTALERFTEAFWKLADDGGNATAECFRRDHFSRRVETEDRSSVYCNAAQGLQLNAPDDAEQTQAVLKIVDHLKNLEHWCPLYESERNWMESLCVQTSHNYSETMDFSVPPYQTVDLSRTHQLDVTKDEWEQIHHPSCLC